MALVTAADPGDQCRQLLGLGIRPLSQRRCSHSPRSWIRRHSTAAGEVWLACLSVALRCTGRTSRGAR